MKKKQFSNDRDGLNNLMKYVRLFPNLPITYFLRLFNS